MYGYTVFLYMCLISYSLSIEENKYEQNFVETSTIQIIMSILIVKSLLCWYSELNSLIYSSKKLNYYLFNIIKEISILFGRLEYRIT